MDINDVTQPVTIKCINCGKEFTGKTQRSQFCSGACKVQFHRNKKRGSTVTPTPDDVTQNPGLYNEAVTVTDQLFIDNAAERGLVDWYVFDKQVYAKTCWQCKKDFKSRLSLNRYCAPFCRDEALKPAK